MTASADQVGRQVRRGLSWNLASAVVTNVVRIAVIAVLGRALTQQDFGVVAAAIAVNVILYGIRDIGVARALIQRKDLDDGHLATGFAVSNYVGLALTAVLWFGAPSISRFYPKVNADEFVPVLRALAFLFAIRGIGTPSRMVLERHMRFRILAVVDAASFALGSTTSMVLAVAGFGPWSIVIGYLVEETSATLAFCAASPPKLTLRIDRGKLRDLMAFGLGQTITQIGGVLSTYGDNNVVGHALGDSQLALYTRAFDLIKMPSFVFEAIVGKVLFPAFAKLQDDRARLALMLRRVMLANSLVLWPASALIIALGPEIIRILVGPGWESSIVPLQILAITVLPRTSQKLAVLVAQAAGKTSQVAVAQMIYAAIVIGGALFSVQWGIAGVATTTAIGIVVMYVLSCVLALRVSRLPALELVRAHVPGLALGAITAAIALPLTFAMRSALGDRVYGGDTQAHAWLVVVAASAAAMIPCAAIVWIWLRRGHGDFAWVAATVLRRGQKATAAP